MNRLEQIRRRLKEYDKLRVSKKLKKELKATERHTLETDREWNKRKREQVKDFRKIARNFHVIGALFELKAKKLEEKN